MKDRKIMYRFLRGIFKPLFMVIFRPEIIGSGNIPKECRAVIAGNHKHALDPILVDVSTKRIVRTLAKKELHDGIFGFIFRGVGTIPVDLHSEKNHDALESAVKVLESDHVINVSPESKRNYTNELLLPFKYGAVAMASRTNSPIIPYAITGDYKLFSKNLKIIFGNPFYVKGDLTAANERLYNETAQLLRSIIDKNELRKKKFTSFKEWENEKKKTS